MSGEEPYLGQGCVTPYRKREVLLRWVWALVQATLFRWSPRPMHGFRAWLLRGFGADIPTPSKVVLFPTVRVVFPWKLSLGPRTMVGPDVLIYNLAPVRLEFGANVSQRCHLCAATHDFNRWSMPLVSRPIIVGRNAWIAADVFVGPGVTVGEFSVVGAGSVVVRDLPPRKVCVGNPCRPIKDRTKPAGP